MRLELFSGVLHEPCTLSWTVRYEGDSNTKVNIGEDYWKGSANNTRVFFEYCILYQTIRIDGYFKYSMMILVIPTVVLLPLMFISIHFTSTRFVL